MVTPVVSEYRVIRLVKVDGSLGRLPVGWVYRWSFKSLTPGEALARAHKALRRDHPDEDVACWQLEG